MLQTVQAKTMQHSGWDGKETLLITFFNVPWRKQTAESRNSSNLDSFKWTDMQRLVVCDVKGGT